MKTRRYAGFLAAFLALAASARVSPLSLADRRSGQHHPDGDDNTQEIGRKERRSMKYFVFALALAAGGAVEIAMPRFLPGAAPVEFAPVFKISL